MKKKIAFITLDSSTAAWMKENLPECELKSGVSSLLRGDCSSLMVELENGQAEQSSSVIQYGELKIDERRRSVERSGVPIALTPKEFDILLFLAQNRGEVFTKEQIYRAVWSENYLLDDSNIMAFIRKLRKKIEPNPDAPEYILTIWGIGYKFNDRI